MPNYPVPALLGSSAAEALSGALDQETGITFIAKGTAPNSSPSLAVQFYRAMRLMKQLIWAAHALFVVPSAAGGLNVEVYRGYYRKSDNTDVTYDGTNSFALTDAATNYVYILHSSNAATKSTSGWPADATTYTPLAIYVCSGGAIITEARAADRRTLALYHTNAAAAAATGTTGTTFTLDSDNAGAEVDMDLLFNRGSTAADAALRWVAADDVFRFLAEIAGPTRAGIDALKYQVSGTDVIDSSGDLAAAAIALTQLYIFGANGATPYGILLTPSGVSGAPSSGTHAAGEITIDSVGVLWVCTTAGTPGTWKRSGTSPSLQVLSIGDGSGLATANIDVTLQVQDVDGNALAGTFYFLIGAYDDADGSALAANATISVPATGTKVRDDQFQGTSSAKVVLVKTNGSGQVVLRVVNTIADAVYLIAQPGPQSRALACNDIGTVTIS